MSEDIGTFCEDCFEEKLSLGACTSCGWQADSAQDVGISLEKETALMKALAVRAENRIHSIEDFQQIFRKDSIIIEGPPNPSTKSLTKPIDKGGIRNAFRVFRRDSFLFLKGNR